jgi:hypothetical protein
MVRYEEIPAWVETLPLWICHSPLLDGRIFNVYRLILNNDDNDISQFIEEHFKNLSNLGENDIDKYESIIYVLDYLLIDEIPPELLPIFRNVDVELIRSLKQRANLPIISKILTFKSIFGLVSLTDRFFRAIRIGNLEYVIYLKESHLRNNPEFVFEDSRITKRAVYHSELDIFKYLVSNNFSCNYGEIFKEIMMYVHQDEKMLSFVRYLRQDLNKIYDSDDDVEQAIVSDRLEYLIYLKECGYDYTRIPEEGKLSFAEYALQSHFIEIFEYLLSINCPFNRDLKPEVIDGIMDDMFSSDEVLEIIHRLEEDSGIQFNTNKKFTTIAARSGHLEVLQYLIGLNCPYDSFEMINGTVKSQFMEDLQKKEIVRYIYDLPWMNLDLDL